MPGILFEDRILVCPACRARLRRDEPKNVVQCEGCRRSYPIREGIPVLLISEASGGPKASPAGK